MLLWVISMQQHFGYWQQFLASSFLWANSPRPHRLLHPWEQLSAEGNLEIQKDPADWLQNCFDGTFWWEWKLFLCFSWITDKLMQRFSLEIFFACLLSDLPLQISYPPDFSDSRHYGLLLLVYVPQNVSEMFTTRSRCVPSDRKWYIS